MSLDSSPSPGTSRSIAVPRQAMLVAAGAGLIALGALAATLALRQPGSAAVPSASGSTSTTSTTSAAATLPAASPKALVPSGSSRPAAATGDRSGSPQGTRPAQPGAAERAADRDVALATRPAAERTPVCASCGTVEAVQAVRQKGEASGVGAVAGGVLGGVVGNQMGKGDGRKAMTVIGAVGGGLAGHEIEKRRRATTAYQVTVRMDDGSSRTVTRPESWAVGRRVTLEGSEMRAMRNSPVPAHAPRALQTAAPA